MTSEVGTNHSLEQIQRDTRATADAFEALGNEFAGRSEFSPLAARSQRRSAELRDDKFTVMVVGEFKRGKSTVLNAMLGTAALPYKPAPCTAVVTFVRYGLQPEVIVAFNDGGSPHPEHLTLAEFKKKYELTVEDTTKGLALATEQEIADRFGSVDHAVIRYPSPFLEHGVEIVDTPGLNEHDARTARVLNNLATADAVLMVLDATAPANQEEIKFIEHRLRPLGLHKHIFFLVNRWNMLEAYLLDPSDPEERKKVFGEQENFINSRLVPFVSEAGRDKAGKRIFKVNALGALRRRLGLSDAPDLEATEFPAFERALSEFLTVDRAAVRRSKDLLIADGIAAEVTSNVDLLIRQARLPIANFEAEQLRLEARINQLDRIRVNIVAIISAQAAEIGTALGETLEIYLSERLFGHLKEHVDRLDLGEMNSIWAAWIALYETAIGAIKRETAEDSLLRRAEAHLQRQVVALIAGQIDEWRAQVFDFEIKQRMNALQAQLKREAGEYVKVIAEIQGDEARSHVVSDQEIIHKMNDWVRGAATDVGSLAVGAGLDLTPIMASVGADVALHVFGTALLVGSVLPVVGLAVTPAVAYFRKEFTNANVRKAIVQGLTERKKEILLGQRHKLLESVNDALKTLSEPISQSIESEIAVLKANMRDVVEQRQKSDFDANAYETALRNLEIAVKRRVAEVHALAS